MDAVAYLSKARAVTATGMLHLEFGQFVGLKQFKIGFNGTFNRPVDLDALIYQFFKGARPNTGRNNRINRPTAQCLRRLALAVFMMFVIILNRSDWVVGCIHQDKIFSAAEMIENRAFKLIGGIGGKSDNHDVSPWFV